MVKFETCALKRRPVLTVSVDNPLGIGERLMNDKQWFQQKGVFEVLGVE